MTTLAWRDHWLDWRNRRLTDPLFQRWAAQFPLTRGIAKRRAQSLFDLVAGFVYSQTLSTCVRLRLLDILRLGPQTSTALADRLGLSVEVAERLLGAAEALDLVDRAGPARYALGSQGAASSPPLRRLGAQRGAVARGRRGRRTGGLLALCDLRRAWARNRGQGVGLFSADGGDAADRRR
jgi:hypothetical protein